VHRDVITDVDIDLNAVGHQFVADLGASWRASDD
jgi:hypothetical protein